MMMNNNSRRLILFSGLLLSVCCTTTATADLIQFGLTSNGIGTISGSTFTAEANGIVSNGVTFDVTLTVTGNGLAVSNDSGGLGVDNPFVETDEALSFSLSIDQVMDGNVTFDGFTSLGFNLFNDFEQDEAVFSTGDQIGNQTITQFDLTTLTGGAPNSFSITGAGELETTVFQLNSITAEYTAFPTNVPEPHCLPVIAIGALVGLVRRR